VGIAPTEERRLSRRTDVPILWLDLRPPETPTLKYVFRLLTRSQPWGYQRKENQSALSAEDRRKFLDRFTDTLPPSEQSKRYLELPLTRFWPWDAKLPVPFAFIRKSLPRNDWGRQIVGLCQRYFPTLKTKYYRSTGDYVTSVAKFMSTPEAKALRQALLSASKFEVPALHIPRELLQQTGARSGGTPRGAVDSEEAPDDIETLFIRINSAGTALVGEELIYSIYKSIFPESIRIVEWAGENFILPSRLVSLATRLVQAKDQKDRPPPRRKRRSNTDRFRLPPKVSVKDFRRLIYKVRSTFKRRLRDFVSNLEQDNVFKKALDVLSGPRDFQLPSALAVDMARQSPEVLFVLIYRLNRGDIIAIGSEQHRRILGFLTALAWFAGGERHKEHDRWLRQLWPHLLNDDQNAFWSRAVLRKTIKPYKDQLVMVPLLPPRNLRKFVKESLIQKGTAWERLESPSGHNYIARWYKSYYESYYESQRASEIALDAWWVFLDKLSQQRGLVLYAQRDTVNAWFPEFNHLGVQELEDTNCPWDWDHIHAQKLIHRKWNVDTALREWHGSIGNLRVWPMELNRSDSDDEPCVKLGCFGSA
jgi:hypothetical protein